jgi:hypothetical protein
MWFQGALFFIFISLGMYYLTRGMKKKDKTNLIAGALLLTFGWTKAVLFLKKSALPGAFEIMVNISEIVVPLLSIIIVAVYLKKWRPYIIGLGLLVMVIVSALYVRVNNGTTPRVMRSTLRDKSSFSTLSQQQERARK